MKPPVKLYWWRHRSGELPNFGDELSRQLVSLMSCRSVVHASPDECDLVAVGSVLEHVSEADRREPMQIWGSGFIKADPPAHAITAAVHTVRGPLTAARIEGCPALGDPALLVRYLVRPTPKRFRVGLVPHYVDLGLPTVATFADHGRRAVVISPLEPPEDVLTKIAACDLVLSSSLHGLIVADSLGVPNIWVEMSRSVSGAGYKFRDYLSCFGIEEPEPFRVATAADLRRAITSPWEDYERPGMEELIAGLVESFPQLD